MENLNKVKRLGFRSAFTVAFHDGKSISLTQAKKLEKAISEHKWQVTLVQQEGMETAEALNIIKAVTDKEITTVNSSGKILFIVTAFDSEEEAEGFRKLSVAGGFKEVSISEI